MLGGVGAIMSTCGKFVACYAAVLLAAVVLLFRTSHHKFNSSLLFVSHLLLCRKPVPSPTNQSHSYESCHKTALM
jgi:hypothetical protein